MTISRLFPSAVFIALTSAFYVFIASYLKISAIWLPYISWSAYFLAGGKSSLLPKMSIALTGGMIIGYLTVVIAPFLLPILGSNLAFPVVVFVMTLMILLFELIKSADMVAVYFFAYTSYFAYFYGNFGGKNTSPMEILPMFWILIMLGLGLGYFTAEMRKKIMKLQS